MGHTVETRKRALAKVKKRRTDWLDANGPCVSCGSSERLEVDHIDPATKEDHRIWSWSEERRATELEKCQVLCHDCHEAKTASDRRAEMQHGTESMYRHCKCTPCVDARNEYRRGQRARRRARGLPAK